MTPSHSTRPGILYRRHHLSSLPTYTTPSHPKRPGNLYSLHHLSSLLTNTTLHIQPDQESYTVFTISLHSLPTRRFTSKQTRNPIQSSPFLFTHYLHNAFTSDQTRDGDHVLPAMLDYKGLLSLNTLHL